MNRLRTAKTTALLAYLAVHPPHRFTRETLADLFGSDMEYTRALNNLSVALNALRHAFHGEQASPLLRSVRMIPERFMADVLEFEHALAIAKRAPETAIRYEQLSRAVHLYQGDFLPSVYDEWALQKAAALQGECLAALEQLTAVDLERGDTLQAQQWLQKTLRITPDDGDALCHLAELYLQARQHEAAAQVCRAWLAQRAEFAETALARRVATLLGEAYRRQGALERAREYLQESAALNRQMGRALALQKVNAAMDACTAPQASAHTPLPHDSA
ncbi:MAG: BTAD domain-containing putative transcriptional regulator [Fimbriimonadales bacterium]